MLKHLFRGWWTKGVCRGEREEGCREEGGLWGYTASYEHVIYEGLGRGVETGRRDDSSEGEATGAYAAKRTRPGHRGTTSWVWGLIGGGRGRGLRGETPAARAQGKGRDGTCQQHLRAEGGQRQRGRGEGRGEGGMSGVGGGGESQGTCEDQRSV